MIFITLSYRYLYLFAALALTCSPAAGAAAHRPLPAEAAAAIAVDLSPDTTKPPLSEEEIFPHLDKPAKGGAKPAAPALPPRAEPALSAAQKRRAEEDKLFIELKRSADFARAEALSRSIEGLWAQSGSDSIDLLMFWANKEIAAKNYAIALDFLDNVVALAPDYAEGWMRRASVHLMTNDIALSMVEMQRVLQLEPRHYNAMLQLGAVMEMTGRPDKAQRAYEKALEFYPQMRSAQRRMQILVEKDSSRAI